jgi:signal transduction histidine kinase
MTSGLITLPDQPADIPPLWPTRVLRYALPIILSLIAMAFEGGEHWAGDSLEVIERLSAIEIFVFATLVPFAVFFALGYIERLLREVDQARLRYISLNNHLEDLVAERTAALQISNQELHVANQRLREADRMKSDFVALVSHELNAPLMTFQGGLEMALEEKDLLPPTAKHIMQLLHSETQRLSRMVRTLLEVSQLEAGKLRLTLGPVAVLPLLRDAVEIVFGQDTQRVFWQLPSRRPPILADETYLGQIIRNLLSNALHYTPPNSTVEISVTVLTTSVQISITDHGPGIPLVEQSQIFERFHRASHGGSFHVNGWGLGLYLSRALTEAQGGTLTLQSPVHADMDAAGACFTVTLPIAEEEPSSGKTFVDLR